MKLRLSAFAVLSTILIFPIAALETPIQSAAIDSAGTVRIRVESTTANYYVLYRRDPQTGIEQAVSVVAGLDQATTLTESLGADGKNDAYRVEEHRLDAPEDIDGDGVDDITELRQSPAMGPLNPAEPLDFRDGVVSIPDRETFEKLSYQGGIVMRDTHLADLEFVKFYILDADTDNPQVLFMNTQTHRAHKQFAEAIRLPGGFSGGRGRGGASTPGQMRGEIVYHPGVIAPNGLPGIYRFEFEPNDSYAFEDVRMAYELIARNMPLLRNNLAYYPMPQAALPRYEREADLYDASRVRVLLEENIYEEVGYIPLNVAEGYGMLRLLDTDEQPVATDIVIFEALPNELLSVGGIITTVPQTPLSHVNLRAIQDGVPNAYINDFLQDKAFNSLIGGYVYYRVDIDSFEIREATFEEVESHYAGSRPIVTRYPVRDLSVTHITSLEQIRFEDAASFGVKTSNVAALHDLDFPESVVPSGFGIPFYFYDEFMKYNGFYDDVETFLENEAFVSSLEVREEILSDFRKKIKKGIMPQSMLYALTELQAAFPVGTSLRCRSSTNAEDLEDFNGAGLYTSKTQHPDEGHILKSVLQVYASLWNLRAFEARELYKIDHFATAMGILVHPAYQNEIANGVAVTKDPFYGTTGTYYVNAQVGEDLVTNPNEQSIPEEILLSSKNGGESTIMRTSNMVPTGKRVLPLSIANELAEYLTIIKTEFGDLYGIEAETVFAMEIEFKVTADGHLSIKQARPWVE